MYGTLRGFPLPEKEHKDISAQEFSPLPPPPPEGRATNGLSRPALLLLTVFGFIALSITTLSGDMEYPTKMKISELASFSELSLATDKETAALGFKVSNEYERKRDSVLNDGLFENMVQVQKNTLLELRSGTVALWFVETDPESGSFIQVPGAGNDLAPTPAIEYSFLEFGVYRVKAVTSESGDFTATSESAKIHQFTVTAKVIRYEIRDLTDEDREIHFDALHTFYMLGQDDGEKEYGKDYKSLYFLVREHLYGAADKECDHWHDDAGILTHHIGITWEMEQSLRKIEPRTAAHYWDYTRETGKGLKWNQSPIFGDEWYGSNSPSNHDHIVDSGRWAYTPVMKKARDFSAVTNPYGLLRSPWNTNPVPYLMRSNYTFYSYADAEMTFPTCAEFASYMNSSLAETLFALNGELHGPVHIMIGGHWDIDSKWKMVGSSLSFSDKYLLLSKWLWRQGFVRTPSVCSEDTPHSDCMPSCPQQLTDHAGYGPLSNHTAYELLKLAGVFNLNPSGATWTETIKESGLDFLSLLKELCHVGSPGDMFTSAAPQDPTFWPLHGNAERFVMYQRVLNKKGTFLFDETWAYAHQSDVPSDTGMVCDWSTVKDDLDMPKCVHDTCPGHRENDLLPFTKLYKGQGDKLITNAELYSRVDPFHDKLPYAYDSLSYWEACTGHSLVDEFYLFREETDGSSSENSAFDSGSGR